MSIFRATYWLYRLCLLSIVFISFFHTLSAQNKIGGICFRVDDNQSAEKWIQYAKVFEKYNQKFSFALNLALIQNNSDYINLARMLQASRHEFMDHTPNHATQYFTIPLDEVSMYDGQIGVDHISNNKICLKFDSVSISANSVSMKGRISANQFISLDNGAFRLFEEFPDEYFGIYIPSTKTVYSYIGCYAKNSDDPDTLTIRSFWNEDINIAEQENIEFRLVDVFNTRINPESLSLLVARSSKIAAEMGLVNPRSWIQPGGRTPQLKIEDIERASDFKSNFIGAALYRVPTLKCFGEYNPDRNKQYGMQWGDFFEDSDPLSKIIPVIADKAAKHYVLIGHSHFNGLLGDWGGYLLRMDSLLSWCTKVGIKIRTQSEWANILYYSEANPYENIFPLLSVDLDDNQTPDGYSLNRANGVLLDTLDGVAESKYHSISTSQVGQVFSVNGLAGIEKGENDFSFYTKTSLGSQFTIYISFPEYPSLPIISFKVLQGDSNWVSNSNVINIPDSVSIINVSAYCEILNGNIAKICGVRLRKHLTVPLKIISVPDTSAPISSMFTYQVEVGGNPDPHNVTYDLLQSPPGFTITDNGKIMGVLSTKPGMYKIDVKANDQMGNVDEQTFPLYVLDTATTTVEYDITVPKTSVLFQNYPNPFNAGTIISYALKSESEVTIVIYNVLGQVIKILEPPQSKSSGYYHINWKGDGTNGAFVGSGVYFYRMNVVPQDGSSQKEIIKKMLLIK